MPADAEWTQLGDYVVSQGFPDKEGNPNGAGNALKSCRQINSPWDGCNTSEHPRWNSNSTHHGFDAFGFSALPGGDRFWDGYFSEVGISGGWWSATESSSTIARARFMGSYIGDMGQGVGNKKEGFSIRCIKNIE